MTDNLLPCPFCGSTDVRACVDADDYRFVNCEHCGARGAKHNENRDAVEAWNDRIEVSRDSLLQQIDNVNAKRSKEISDTNVELTRMHNALEKLSAWHRGATNKYESYFHSVCQWGMGRIDGPPNPKDFGIE